MKLCRFRPKNEALEKKVLRRYVLGVFWLKNSLTESPSRDLELRRLGVFFSSDTLYRDEQQSCQWEVSATDVLTQTFFNKQTELLKK
jgi:hypothetical protein